MSVLRACSYGGGVQSTALLVLAAQGRIDFPLFLFANVAEALMTNDLGPRYWRLHPGDNPGEWTCPGPGTAGPLSEMLRGIADSYLDREAVAS